MMSIAPLGIFNDISKSNISEGIVCQFLLTFWHIIITLLLVNIIYECELGGVGEYLHPVYTVWGPSQYKDVVLPV